MRSLELSTIVASSRAVYSMPSQHQDKPDQIEVPAEEVERLRGRGGEKGKTGSGFPMSLGELQSRSCNLSIQQCCDGLHYAV